MSVKISFIYSLKLFLSSPPEFFQELFIDLKKDISAKSLQSKYKFVWCAGLPKSGTTLIETVLNTLPYVQLDKSPLRIFDNKYLNHPHGISDRMFKNVPKEKYTFLKTHSHFNQEYLNLANNYNAKIILSFRDLRDMMISNYFYTLKNKNAWGHNEIESLPFKEGFMKSLTLSHEKHKDDIAIKYYYKWIKDWINISEQSNCLVLWYESYLENPIRYISEILDYLEFDYIDAKNIEKKLMEARKLNLEENLSRPGRKLSTFNRGKTALYKEFFDNEIENYFQSLLPGSLDDITYKG